jgi:hypothetical protein
MDREIGYGVMKQLFEGKDFGSALAHLRSGRRVWRSGWNGKGMWLCLQTPTETSKMTLPYIFMSTAQSDYVPWLASQTDLLSEDWCGEV